MGTPTKGIDETSFTTLTGQDKKSLAILPFRNIGNDPASSFYEFSLADAVITELARVRSLVVRPSSVIARYQGQQVDPREVGRELNVDSVLAAGFIHAGERFRVTAQLLDVLSGDILWSDRIDTSAADIITVQDTIAQRIVEGLSLELSPAEQVGIAKPSTQSAAVSLGRSSRPCPQCRNASTASATIRRTPTLLVRAAPAPATAAHTHRFLRANQNALTESSRNSGSV